MTTPSSSPVLVTGAAGHLGRRVVELLLAREAGPVIATTRDPARLADLAARGAEVRAADFDDPASLAQAFRGVGRALLVSTDAMGRRVAQHTNAVRALAAAGARHVVYTSIPEPTTSVISVAPEHAATEAALAASPLEFTVLRNNLYADLTLVALPGALAAGRLVDAREDGAVAYVTREDCARAAVGALLDAGFRGRRTLDVTGPAAVTSRELAALASELGGRAVEYVPVTPEERVRGLVAHGMPEPLAEIFTSFDRGIARGELARATDAVERLTGERPQSVREFLLAHRAALTAG